MPKWFAGVAIVLVAFVCGFLAITELLLPRVVGLGEESMVPDVVGMAEEDAMRRLIAAQLEGEVRHERPDSEAAAGIVMEQDPHPGQVVKSGRKIGLTLSSGAESVVIPTLVGRSLRQARIDLASVGLHVEDVVRAESQKIRAEHVVATVPAEGTVLAIGGALQVLVSTGPAPSAFLMPDLQGRDFSQVRSQLESQGFQVERARYTGGSGGVERVRSQEPPAGARVMSGARIALTVSGE